MAAPTNKLRVLAIHGYRQSDFIFRGKLGSLRQGFKKEIEFTFINAPHEIPVKNDGNGEEEKSGYGWWFNTESLEFRAIEPSDLSVGFEDSLNLIKKVIEEQGPFDGILGFSQGGAFAVILCAMQQKKLIPFSFKFAIIISGFKSLCLPHQQYYDEKIDLPSYHVYGETDRIIPSEMTEDVCELFLNHKKFIHEGGHYIPGKKHIYKDFITEMFENKNEKK